LHWRGFLRCTWKIFHHSKFYFFLCTYVAPCPLPFGPLPKQQQKNNRINNIKNKQKLKGIKRLTCNVLGE
jgi:hypothetical protein